MIICSMCAHITLHGVRCELASSAFPHASRCKQYQDYHTGGCAFCAYARGGKCRHPSNSAPMPYRKARALDAPCGPHAHLWERYGFEDWDAQRIDSALGGAAAEATS